MSRTHNKWKWRGYLCVEYAPAIAGLFPKKALPHPCGLHTYSSCGGVMAIDGRWQANWKQSLVFAQWLLSLSFLTHWRLNVLSDSLKVECRQLSLWAISFLTGLLISLSLSPTPLPDSCSNLRMEKGDHWTHVGLVWGHDPCELLSECCEVLLLTEQGHCVSVPFPILRPSLVVFTMPLRCYLAHVRRCLLAYEVLLIHLKEHPLLHPSKRLKGGKRAHSVVPSICLCKLSIFPLDIYGFIILQQ